MPVLVTISFLGSFLAVHVDNAVIVIDPTRSVIFRDNPLDFNQLTCSVLGVTPVNGLHYGSVDRNHVGISTNGSGFKLYFVVDNIKDPYLQLTLTGQDGKASIQTSGPGGAADSKDVVPTMAGVSVQMGI